ncbi:MAG: hypothetical protein VX955_04890 [Pseudomonadota bacterium]|nr:hypothetical protein [Pseudomonadota bacterium]
MEEPEAAGAEVLQRAALAERIAVNCLPVRWQWDQQTVVMTVRRHPPGPLLQAELVERLRSGLPVAEQVVVPGPIQPSEPVRLAVIADAAPAGWSVGHHYLQAVSEPLNQGRLQS